MRVKALALGSLVIVWSAWCAATIAAEPAPPKMINVFIRAECKDLFYAPPLG